MNEKGHGRIRVDTPSWVDLGLPETPEQWHKAIMLPDTIEIERVERSNDVPPRHSLFELYVASEIIPQSETLIEVSVIHRQDYGVVSFDRIQMSTWDGKHWRTIEPVGERIHEH